MPHKIPSLGRDQDLISIACFFFSSLFFSFLARIQYKVNASAISGNMPRTSLQLASREEAKRWWNFSLSTEPTRTPRQLRSLTQRHYSSLPLKVSSKLPICFCARSWLGSEGEVLEVVGEQGRIVMVQLLLHAGAKLFREGKEQYEKNVRRASDNGHHAIRRLLES
jgi:hypothetical protein